MGDAEHFLRDLALVLSVAAVVTVVFRLIKQPLVLGYLLAGMIVGPHIPIPLVADTARIRTLSELGVILVMFSIGLELSIRKLLSILPTSGLTGAIQLSGMFWLGYTAGRVFGWTATECLFTGAMLAVSSTMIVARTFAEERVDAGLSEIVFGVLVVQDLAAIVMLAVLTAIAGGDAGASEAVARTTFDLAIFLVIAVTVGFLVVPRGVRLVARLGSPETLLVASVGFCFAASLLAHELGYSVALGAFLAGSLIAESGKADEVERLVVPLRDLFAAIFFVAVGMMIDPHVILERWAAVLVLTALVLVGQSALVAIGSFLSGNDLRSSVRAGMSLAQIGEFSFIIASVGVSAGAVSDFLYPVAVAVCLLTSFATPWMVRASGAVALFVERKLPHSVQTFASLYGSWREQLRQRPSAQSGHPRLRRLVWLMVIDGLVLAAVPIAAVVGSGRYLDALTQRVGVPRSVAAVVLISVTVALALPFAIGLVRCAQAVGRVLAAMVLPAAAPGALDLAAAPRRAFLVALQLGMALLVGLPFLAVTQPFFPYYVALPALAAVIVLLGVSFWRRANDLEEHVHAGAHLVLETLTRKDATPGAAPASASLPQVEAILPGLGSLTAIPVPPGSAAVGRSLIDLNLRGLTGASVIAISGAGGDVAAPTGREILAAGDILTVTGTSEAVARAAALLAAPDAGSPRRDPRS